MSLIGSLVVDRTCVVRRHAIAVALVSGLLSVPLGVRSQVPRRLVRLGWLSEGAFLGSPLHSPFVEVMRSRGWIEGRHFVIEARHSRGRNEGLPALAAELVRLKVDLIICTSSPSTAAAQAATSTVPIVFIAVSDPVGSGFVASLARPGGNVTGLGGLGADIRLKQLELLQQVAPREPRVAMFFNPEFGFHAHARVEIEAAARQRGITLLPIEVRSPKDIDAAFAVAERERVDALLLLGQAFYLPHSARIAQRAIALRLPTVLPNNGAVRAGVLMSYGSRVDDEIERLPSIIERIANGASPGTIPVEQPSRFYLALNLRTARAMGLKVPRSLILSADEIID